MIAKKSIIGNSANLAKGYKTTAEYADIITKGPEIDVRAFSSLVVNDDWGPAFTAAFAYGSAVGCYTDVAIKTSFTIPANKTLNMRKRGSIEILADTDGVLLSNASRIYDGVIVCDVARSNDKSSVVFLPQTKDSILDGTIITTTKQNATGTAIELRAIETGGCYYHQIRNFKIDFHRLGIFINVPLLASKLPNRYDNWATCCTIDGIVMQSLCCFHAVDYSYSGASIQGHDIRLRGNVGLKEFYSLGVLFENSEFDTAIILNGCDNNLSVMLDDAGTATTQDYVLELTTESINNTVLGLYGPTTSINNFGRNNTLLGQNMVSHKDMHTWYDWEVKPFAWLNDMLYQAHNRFTLTPVYTNSASSNWYASDGSLVGNMFKVDRAFYAKRVDDGTPAHSAQFAIEFSSPLTGLFTVLMELLYKDITVTVEVKTSGNYTALTSSALEITNLVTRQRIQATIPSALYLNVTGLRITFSTSTNPFIGIARISGYGLTSDATEDTCFLYKHGGKLYGNVSMLNSYFRLGNVAVLPAASSDYRGDLIRVEGSTGVKDKSYICEKSTGDNYYWRELEGFTAVPATSTAAGTAGQWSADANYAYFCPTTDTWIRVAKSTW